MIKYLDYFPILLLPGGPEHDRRFNDLFDDYANYLARELHRSQAGEADLSANLADDETIGSVQEQLRQNSRELLEATQVASIPSALAELDTAADLVRMPAAARPYALTSLHLQLAAFKAEQLAAAANAGDQAKIDQAVSEMIELGRLSLRKKVIQGVAAFPTFSTFGTTTDSQARLAALQERKRSIDEWRQIVRDEHADQHVQRCTQELDAAERQFESGEITWQEYLTINDRWLAAMRTSIKPTDNSGPPAK